MKYRNGANICEDAKETKKIMADEVNIKGEYV
jgi:hypothetical protein